MFENNSLDEIAKFYKTDKSSDFHDYCKKYEKYLPFKRSDYLNILDSINCSGIAVAPIPDQGLGKTINDRLRRASYKDEQNI